MAIKVLAYSHHDKFHQGYIEFSTFIAIKAI